MYKLCTQYKQVETEYEKNTIALKFAGLYSKYSTDSEKMIKEFILRKSGVNVDHI